MFAVRNYQQGVQRLLAACDEDLLGQQFAEGRFRLDVKQAFYDGMRVDEQTLATMMRQCTMANLVGPNTVAAAIELELIEAANVMHVEGVPHAQMLVMLSMMCVECGVDAPGLIDGSCAACFSSQNRLLTIPEVVQVEICAHCGARHEGAHWYDVPEGEIERWTLEDSIHGAAGIHREVESPDLEISMEQKDNKTFAITVTLEGQVQDVDVSETHTGLLRRRQGVCNRCSRIHGGYFAAIIQLRASERDMTEPELALAHKIVAQDLDRQINSGNRFAFLAKSGPMHGGYDYYIGDIDAGRNVARRLKTRLGGTVQESAKLVGRKEGEDVYRVTFLARLATFSPGDILLRDGHPFQVLQVHQKVINAFDLERQLRGRISPDGLRRVGGIELLKDAIVVSRGPDGLMVLDPDTQRAETILVPADADIGETVTVVRIDERLYWVPSDGRSINLP